MSERQAKRLRRAKQAHVKSLAREHTGDLVLLVRRAWPQQNHRGHGYLGGLLAALQLSRAARSVT